MTRSSARRLAHLPPTVGPSRVREIACQGWIELDAAGFCGLGGLSYSPTALMPDVALTLFGMADIGLPLRRRRIPFV
jgi:hypothetical protein